MSENLRAYTKALYGMDHVVRQASPEAWDRQSPCEQWTARQVLGHVIAIQRYFESVIRGTENDANPFADDPGQYAGDDPGATWAATVDSLLEALDHPGVIHRRIEAWGRPNTVDGMIGFNCADTTIHTWDVARALGLPDDRLDDAMVARVLAMLERFPSSMRKPPFFAEGVEVPETGDPQTRMLALAGRRR